MLCIAKKPTAIVSNQNNVITGIRKEALTTGIVLRYRASGSNNAAAEQIKLIDIPSLFNICNPPPLF